MQVKIECVLHRQVTLPRGTVLDADQAGEMAELLAHWLSDQTPPGCRTITVVLPSDEREVVELIGPEAPPIQATRDDEGRWAFR